MKNKMNVLLVVCLLAASFDADAGNLLPCSPRCRRVAVSAAAGAAAGVVAGVVAGADPFNTGIIAGVAAGGVGGLVEAIAADRARDNDIAADRARAVAHRLAFEELFNFRNPDQKFELAVNRRIDGLLFPEGKGGFVRALERKNHQHLMARLKLVVVHEGHNRGMPPKKIDALVAKVQAKYMREVSDHPLAAELFAKPFEGGKRFERDARAKSAATRQPRLGDRY